MTALPDWHGRGESVELAEGGSLYYEVEGEGPAVLLIGGGPGADHSHYHPWFSTLARTHTVVYYDHPGTGRSTGGADCYTVPRYATAIEQLRDHLHLETVSLIGLSFGGLPAVEYALRYPRRITSLVLSNAQVSAHGWQVGNIDHVNSTLRLHFPDVWEEVLTLRKNGVLSLDSAYQELVGHALPSLEWADPGNRPQLLADRRFAVEAYEAFVGPDPEWVVGGSLRGYEPALESITTPTLVVVGRHDGLTLPAIAAACATRIPHSRWHVFENSSHRPWAEEPTAYADVVREFLATA